MLLSLLHRWRREDSDRCCDLPIAIELKMSSLGQRKKKPKNTVEASAWVVQYSSSL